MRILGFVLVTRVGILWIVRLKHVRLTMGECATFMGIVGPATATSPDIQRGLLAVMLRPRPIMLKHNSTSALFGSLTSTRPLIASSMPT